ncbi:hypothetical protein THIOKS12580023 [Thiocapsa sp. KS1]|nr:hypothetical protein THIOKS12580023 [Thiocapsa sp. KS1]
MKESRSSGDSAGVTGNHLWIPVSSEVSSQESSARPYSKLVFLPPYPPNLNPIERLWKLLMKTTLYNHY